MKYPEKVSKHIINWIDEYLNRSGMKGLVVGVSGGIDSALTSTLCAETGRDVTCIEMPIYQNKDQVSRSKKHIDWLKKKYSNVSSMIINLDNTYNSFIESIPKIESPENELSLANTRSRLRMVTLYYFSSLNKFVVAGTGNKVEDFGIGFYTKYGDGGVDISPIADLLKSDVYKLAKFHKINDEIIKAEPTDGLWDDNRNDEDQIGASYKELEKAMSIADKIDQDLSEREKEVLNIYKTFNSSNRHKMLPIPVCKIPKGYLR
ncbi:MAG: NAD(+) synthase [Flavobacteriaceae bacterium]|nr:NAD(+) synthase [Flavobacteriaceae bacterium]|tara:strand:+ start:641 stop:1426 length:786 start_codon:yes stop_codon:yes gene_type:complete